MCCCPLIWNLLSQYVQYLKQIGSNKISFICAGSLAEISKRPENLHIGYTTLQDNSATHSNNHTENK